MKTVELHTHTKYSKDSVTSVYGFINSCLERKIDVVAVTDHNEVAGAQLLAKIAPFQVIVGEEILTKDGEIIGLFLKERVTPGLSMKETIKRIKFQKGLVYLPHPYDKTTRRTSILPSVLDENIRDVDMVEIYNGRSVLPWNNWQAKKLAQKYNKLEVIGSDSHTYFEYGRNTLRMGDFSNANEFLLQLKTATKQTSPVRYWVFFVTKWARYFNKNLRNKSFKTNRNVCDVCGSSNYQIIYPKKGVPKDEYLITDNSYGVHFQMVKCVDCELTYAFPLDGEKKIVKRYQDFEDPEYELEHKSRAENQARILKKINKLFPKKGKLLEVGCATGGFLELAKKSGWDVKGVEPSKWAASIASKTYKIPVFQGLLENAKFKDDSFDVVVVLDVIEHVSSPRELLQNIKRLLKKNGIVCIVTPNIGGVIPRILGEKWWHIRSDHIFYFNDETIKTLLFSEGFRVKSISTCGWTFSYDYWVSRFKNNLEFIYLLARVLKKVSLFNFLTKRNYSIDFRDSMELYCYIEKK